MPIDDEDRPWSRPLGETRQWFMPTRMPCGRLAQTVRRALCLAAAGRASFTLELPSSAAAQQCVQPTALSGRFCICYNAHSHLLPTVTLAGRRLTQAVGPPYQTWCQHYSHKPDDRAMVVVYTCDICTYEVAIGPLHYHVLESGFSGELLLMCRSCGTPHQIVYALRPEDIAMMRDSTRRWNVSLLTSGKNHIGIMQIIRRVQGVSLKEARERIASIPMVIAADLHWDEAQVLHQQLTALGAVLKIEEQVEASEDFFIPQQQDQFFFQEMSTSKDAQWKPAVITGERAGITQEFQLSQQHCAVCMSLGNLVSDLPDITNVCPKCRQTSLRKTVAWVT
jgi:hypothetical protein